MNKCENCYHKQACNYSDCNVECSFYKDKNTALRRYRKMTEKEVIKALECCLDDAWEDCDKCPLEKFPDDYIGCRKNLMKVTIDFINRQKAEIEQLKKEKKKCTKMLYALKNMRGNLKVHLNQRSVN